MFPLPTKPNCRLLLGCEFLLQQQFFPLPRENGTSMLCLLLFISPAVGRTLRYVKDSTITQDIYYLVYSHAHVLFLLLHRNIFSIEPQSNADRTLALKFQRNLPSWIIILNFFCRAVQAIPHEGEARGT